MFIREIIYDNKEITILYNFTDNNTLTRKQITDNIEEVIGQSEMAVSNIKCGSSKHHNSAQGNKTSYYVKFVLFFMIMLD